MDTCDGIIESMIDHLQQIYSQSRFSVERDIVWTLQTWMREELVRRQLSHRVFNDFPMLPGGRRSLSADLAIVDGDQAEVVVEFKYEPSHRRSDIWKGKFPVVTWSSVASDVQRIHDFVNAGKCRKAYAILIDEGQYFKRRPVIADGRWEEWEINCNDVPRVSLHICETSANTHPAP